MWTPGGGEQVTWGLILLRTDYTGICPSPAQSQAADPRPAQRVRVCPRQATGTAGRGEAPGDDAAWQRDRPLRALNTMSI